MDFSERGCVNVADHIPAAGDVADALQKLIDENPQRTLFFPDGEYRLSKPVKTPANPAHAVSLKLSAFAIVKPTETWESDEAMIRFGAAEPFNNITEAGSYYGIEGGVIDCCGRAGAISIDSGRETFIRCLSVKNTRLGIHIKRGANNGSSDADIRDVNIVGNGDENSIGVLVEGYDNTISNMRIAGVHTGVDFKSGGNYIRQVHPLYTFNGACASDEVYRTSCAFRDVCSNNWYDNCYSDQFAVGFYSNGARRVYDNCFALWYTPRGGEETAFYFDGRFNCIIRSATVSMHEGVKSSFLTCTEDGGNGVIENPIFNEDRSVNKQYRAYITGKIFG